MAKEVEAKKESAMQAARTKAETCAICSKTYGQDPEKDDIWISCDSCHLWHHGECAEITNSMLDIIEDEETWECHDCWFKR